MFCKKWYTEVEIFKKWYTQVSRVRKVVYGSVEGAKSGIRKCSALFYYLSIRIFGEECKSKLTFVHR